MKLTEVVQIDATYKVTWNGYPLMLVGTTDQDRAFHPFGVAVCKSEHTDDYEFIFDAFHRADLQWKPKVLLADASEAITASFRRVFGEPSVRGMCYFHVLHNIEKYLKILTKNGVCGHIKTDLAVLQMCENKAT